MSKILYKIDMEVAGLYDVCDWFIENYPDDIFVSKNHPVHKIRDLCKKIKQKQKEVKVE